MLVTDFFMKCFQMVCILLVFANGSAAFGTGSVAAHSGEATVGTGTVAAENLPAAAENNAMAVQATVRPGPAAGFGAGTARYTFHITLEDVEDGEIYELTGDSEFTVTPSSYSVLLNGDQGRCGVHLLNFKEPPGVGIYDVEETEDVRTGVVCVLDVTEPVERMASHTGTFTISHIDGKKLAGELDIVLKGGITGKSFRLTGTVSSENLPLNLDF